MLNTIIIFRVEFWKANWWVYCVILNGWSHNNTSFLSPQGINTSWSSEIDIYEPLNLPLGCWPWKGINTGAAGRAIGCPGSLSRNCWDTWKNCKLPKPVCLFYLKRDQGSQNFIGTNWSYQLKIDFWSICLSSAASNPSKNLLIISITVGDAMTIKKEIKV